MNEPVARHFAAGERRERDEAGEDKQAPAQKGHIACARR